jgi:uncharacterized protein
MLTVDITSLSSGIHQLEMDPSADAAGLDPTTFGDLRVEAELQCHRDRILVDLRATAVAQLTCDRTLQPFEQAVEGQYSVLFGPPEMVGQDGEAFDEVRPLSASDQEIDLTDVVRDTLLLALPQRQIAPGAEDEPIDRAFGAPDEDEADDQTPVDPRWDELRKLRDDDAS